MERIEEIRQEIEALKARLDEVTGTKTEVYTRIVGYYRSLSNWNRGKREEYDHRVTFEVTEEAPAFDNTQGKAAPAGHEQETTGNVAKAVSYELFVRETCPNCPAMKHAMTSVAMAGREIDVDTDEGMSRAIELSIYATPTVVFFDAEQNECSRASSPMDVQVYADLAVV